MKSKILSFNKHIIVEDFKRYWGASVLYFLALFFTGPLDMAFLLNKINSNRYSYDNFNNIIDRFLSIKYSDVQIVFSIGLPILLAMLIYRYLQQSRSTTTMHSLPITRGQLFNSHNIAGVLLLFIPVLLNSIIMIMILVTYNDGSKLFQEVFTVAKIFKWMGYTTLNNTIVYFISSLVAMISGISLVQGMLSLILLFFPIGFGNLMISNLEQLLYGFTINQEYIFDFFMNVFPITSFLSNNKIGSEFQFLLWYGLLIILLYFGAYYLYKKRHLESAANPIAFDILKPIFKYGVTFCTMVLGGAYFYGIEKIESWLYIGYFIGGLIGYIIAEMIIKKSIWVFKNLKGFILYSVVIIIVFTGIKLDIFGYERRLPDLENIESAYYGYHLYSYWKGEENSLERIENIKYVRELHQELIQNKNEFIYGDDNGYRHLAIAYKLKNGRVLARDYRVPNEFAENNRNISKIYLSEEYKINHYDIFDLDLSEVNFIQVNPWINHSDKHVQINDKDEISEIINAIKADILDETYEEFINNKGYWADVSINYNKKEETSYSEEYYRVDMEWDWKKSYVHLTKWLKEKGYYEKSRIMPEDVDFIIIEETSEDLENSNSYDTEDLEKQLSEKRDVRRMEIKDNDKIEEVLVNFNRGGWRNKEYIVGIYFTNGDDYLGLIEGKDLPKFIKDYFNQ